MQIYKNYFGEKLKSALSASGINQRELSDLLDVKTSTVSRWVNGHDFPDDQRLPEICKAVGVKANYFLEPGSKSPQAIDFSASILSNLASLSPEKQSFVLALIFDDESYISANPDLNPIFQTLSKAP